MFEELYIRVLFIFSLHQRDTNVRTVKQVELYLYKVWHAMVQNASH